MELNKSNDYLLKFGHRKVLVFFLAETGPTK